MTPEEEMMNEFIESLKRLNHKLTPMYNIKNPKEVDYYIFTDGLPSESQMEQAEELSSHPTSFFRGKPVVGFVNL